MSGRWLSQTRIHAPDLGIQGNCTQAAVASLLGLELCDVPDFNAGDALAWHQGLNRFFASRGFEILRIDSHRHFKGLYLASGPTRRGTQHMIVMRDGETVHDPYPGGFGLTKVECVWVPVPLDPATRFVPMPAELDGLSRAATAGSWYVTPEDVEGSYSGGGSRWKSYEIRTEAEKHYGKEAVVMDATNSEVTEIREESDEDGVRAWDEPSRANTEYVAALVNWHRQVQDATSPDPQRGRASNPGPAGEGRL